MYMQNLNGPSSKPLVIDIRGFLILYLLVSSADNFCKPFWTRSGPTKCRAWLESKQVDTLMALLKECFEKADFEKH